MATIIELLSVPLGYVIRFCQSLVGNYAVSLVLFALLIKIILFPLGIKQQKAMIQQAKLRPKELAIRGKYKGRTDKATQTKMQQELQDMYSKEKYNPMGSCLPLLFQMPILFSLYTIITNPLKYICQFTVNEVEAIIETVQKITGDYSGSSTPAIKAIEYMINSPSGKQNVINNLPIDGSNYVEGLSQKLSAAALPDFKLFGIFDLTVIPTNQLWPYILLPILTFVIVFATMKLQKKFTYQPPQAEGQAAMSMKLMDITMPLFSAYIAAITCSAIGIYWMAQNVLGFLQQVILAKMFPIPKMTDEEIKAAQKAADKEAAALKKSEKQANKGKVRSLHHIDDDDYAQPPKNENNNKENTDTSSENSIIGKATLKDDKKH